MKKKFSRKVRGKNLDKSSITLPGGTVVAGVRSVGQAGSE